MGADHVQFLAGHRVPELDDAVLTRGGQAPAVGTEADLQHGALVALERGDLLAGRRVAQRGDAGFVGAGQAAGVGTVGHRGDALRMFAEVRRHVLAEVVQVVPLPAAQLVRGAVEDLGGLLQIVIAPGQVGLADALGVQRGLLAEPLARRFPGPFIGAQPPFLYHPALVVAPSPLAVGGLALGLGGVRGFLRLALELRGPFALRLGLFARVVRLLANLLGVLARSLQALQSHGHVVFQLAILVRQLFQFLREVRVRRGLGHHVALGRLSFQAGHFQRHVVPFRDRLLGRLAGLLFGGRGPACFRPGSVGLLVAAAGQHQTGKQRRDGPRQGVWRGPCPATVVPHGSVLARRRKSG